MTAEQAEAPPRLCRGLCVTLTISSASPYPWPSTALVAPTYSTQDMSLPETPRLKDEIWVANLPDTSCTTADCPEPGEMPSIFALFFRGEGNFYMEV